jgi:hypothetical protein
MSDAPRKRTSEETLKRTPHPDFDKVQALRPDWSSNAWHYTKTKDPTWKWGQGANDGGESLRKGHIEIDPYEEGSQFPYIVISYGSRAENTTLGPSVANYKLLISGIIPRPIGFISTVSKDGGGILV